MPHFLDRRSGRCQSTEDCPGSYDTSLASIENHRHSHPERCLDPCSEKKTDRDPGRVISSVHTCWKVGLRFSALQRTNFKKAAH